MTRQIRIKGSFKPVTDKSGKVKVARDHAAAEAKLDVSTRLKRRNSKKVTVKRRGA